MDLKNIQELKLNDVKLPSEDLSSPAASTNGWGKVYQKYISTNLSSENLAKGSFDAYNLLSAGILKSFSTSVASSLDGLDTNLKTLLERVNLLTECVQAGFSNIGADPDDQDTAGHAINPLKFPLDDYDSECSSVYDLGKEKKISLAMYDTEKGTGYPGLLRGNTLHDIEAMSSKFMEGWEELLTDYDPEDLATGEFPGSWNNFSNISNNFFTGPLFTDFTETNLHEYDHYDTPPPESLYSALGLFYSETSLSSLLVTQMNIIQSHLVYLSGVVSRMLNGDITFQKLSAALIQMKDQDTASESAMDQTTVLADVPYLNPRAYKIERFW